MDLFYLSSKQAAFNSDRWLLMPKHGPRNIRFL